jgi:hypothetical protein
VSQEEREATTDSIRNIESRQDEVLHQLDLLEQRLAALLADYAANPATIKKAA